MFPTKLKIVTAAVLAAGVLAGAGVLSYPAFTAPAPAAPKVPKELLEKRYEAAMRAYDMKLRIYQVSIGSVSPPLGWSERWLEAVLALTQKKADDILALKEHLDRTREVERIAVAYVKAGVARQADADAASYERINAEIRILQATGEVPPPPVYHKPVPIPEGRKLVKEQDEDEREAAAKQKKRQLRQENKQPPQRDTKEAAPAKDRKALLQQRRDVVRRVYEGKMKSFFVGRGVEPSDLLGWSERLLEAELALCDKKEDRLAALKAHLARTRDLEQYLIACVKAGRGSQPDADAATYERIQAEIRYFQATGELPPPPPVRIKSLPPPMHVDEPGKKDDKP